MFAFIVKRVAFLPVVIVGVITITFTLMYLIPGDPAVLLAGPYASQDEIEALRVRLGLDRPVIVMYLEYIRDLGRLNFGTSLRTRRPVIHEIMLRLPNTFTIAGLAILLATIFGLFAGILSAVKHLSVVDNVIMLIALLGVSTPSFWLGLLLMLLFAVQLGWLPVAGKGSWRNLVMPTLTLAARATGEIARMSRSDVLEVLHEDYITTARAKGLPELAVVLKHVLKNALVPTVTIIGLRFGMLLSGAVLTETIFAWPGVGRLLVGAIKARDFPMVQGCIIVISLSFILVNLVVDFIYMLLDPHIRYG